MLWLNSVRGELRPTHSSISELTSIFTVTNTHTGVSRSGRNHSILISDAG